MTVMPNGVNLTPDTNGVSRTDAASAENGPQLDALYTQWKLDPASVDAQWHAFFAGFELGCQQPPRRGGLGAPAQSEREARGAALAVELATTRLQQSRVDALVSAYRRLGHQQAKLDPLNLIKRRTPELSFDYMKLTEADLDHEFEIYWAGKPTRLPLHNIIDLLHETYCGHVGIEYMHIENYTIRRWLRDRIEEGRLRKDTLPNAEKKRVLTHLLEGELFEKFLHTRYVGQKRFSLEGGETIIARNLIWAAGIIGNTLAGMPSDCIVRGNRFKTNRYHEVEGTDGVYAIGDIAWMATPKYPNGHPQLANVAIAQSGSLSRNFKRESGGKPRIEFEYSNKGTMATVGKRKAVVDLPGFSFQGFFAWLTWMFVHLMLILSVKNKLFIFLNWMMSYFANDSTLRLMLKPDTES